MTEPKISQCHGVAGSDEIATLIKSTCHKLYDLGLSKLYVGATFKILPKSYNGSLCDFDQADDSITFSMEHFHPCRLDFLIYKALGKKRWAEMSNLEKLAWECKHVIADMPTILKIQDQLHEGVEYDKIIESFSGSVQKLITIHILNALTASNVHPETAKRIILTEHPATREMASGMRPFSLVPLLSVYAQEELMSFPYAVGYMFIGNGQLPVTEDSTRVKLQELVGAML